MSWVDGQKLTFVVGFRDRGWDRLFNCVKSLYYQTHPKVEVVVSILGGEKPPKQWLNLYSTFKEKVKILYVEHEGLWNRANALNIGLRNATGDFIVCTDADLVFSQKVATETMKIFLNYPRAYIYSNFYMLPKNSGEIKELNLKDLKTLMNNGSWFEMVGTGGFQCMPKRFWQDIKGYKEVYEGWGVEDVDLFRRAMNVFGSTHCLPREKCPILHQWHEPETKLARERKDSEFLEAVARNNSIKIGEGKGDL